MRKAINNNPVVQIGLLGVLGVLVAVVFMSGMGGDPAPPPEEDAAATESAAPAAAAPAADPAAAPAAGAPVTPAPEAAPTAAPGSAPFEASKGLPKGVVEDYESGKIVVLLVLDKKGYEDKALLREVDSAEFPDDTVIFFVTTGEKSKEATASSPEVNPITTYSRIAEGVGLDRAPAIIVLHPLEGKLAKGEEVPMPPASVSYGYRGKESVTQAVNDALYKGDSKPYAP